MGCHVDIGAAAVCQCHHREPPELVPIRCGGRVRGGTIQEKPCRGVPPQGGGGGYNGESRMENEDEFKVSSVVGVLLELLV